LFASAAEAFGAEVIALVLTGGDGDGSGGLSTVKQHGGIVVSQDEASARDPSMPRAAVATGDVDYVLPLASIASTLEHLVRGSLAVGAAHLRDERPREPLLAKPTRDGE
jgi:two-component system chemotaxis response regulator CheB